MTETAVVMRLSIPKSVLNFSFTILATFAEIGGPKPSEGLRESSKNLNLKVSLKIYNFPHLNHFLRKG